MSFKKTDKVLCPLEHDGKRTLLLDSLELWLNNRYEDEFQTAQSYLGKRGVVIEAAEQNIAGSPVSIFGKTFVVTKLVTLLGDTELFRLQIKLDCNGLTLGNYRLAQLDFSRRPGRAIHRQAKQTQEITDSLVGRRARVINCDNLDCTILSAGYIEKVYPNGSLLVKMDNGKLLNIPDNQLKII